MTSETGARSPDPHADHWETTYEQHPQMYGDEPSEAAELALELADGNDILELGAGHGRDSLHFALKGREVTALDFSSNGLGQAEIAAARRNLGGRLTTLVHDVREPIPLPEDSFDLVFAHMLLCMALTSSEIADLVVEARRVLRPGGLLIYTVRHVGDAHFGVGADLGDNTFEESGFGVHFFDQPLVDQLGLTWEVVDQLELEEGALPRRLWWVAQRKPT